MDKCKGIVRHKSEKSQINNIQLKHEFKFKTIKIEKNPKKNDIVFCLNF